MLPITEAIAAFTRIPGSRCITRPANSPMRLGVSMLTVTPLITDRKLRNQDVGLIYSNNNFHFAVSSSQFNIINKKTPVKTKVFSSSFDATETVSINESKSEREFTLRKINHMEVTAIAAFIITNRIFLLLEFIQKIAYNKQTMLQKKPVYDPGYVTLALHMEVNKIVLGIDPGTSLTGYGVIEMNGTVMKLVAAGVIELQKLSDHQLKLKKIFERTLWLIDEFHPDEIAVEAPFFGKNVQSMLKLGRAQGVAIAAGLSRSVPVFEYAPRKIKLAVTGSGNASKEQVAAMLQTILGFSEMPKYLDATDGLAAAVCHQFQGKKSVGSLKNYSGWKSFLTENPSRKA